jgi:hypothetical protein
MGLWRGRRERGTAVVFVGAPGAAEVTTGRLVSVEGDRLTIEDDAGATRTVDRARTFRATPDHLARLRALQVTERLLHDQFEALMSEMEGI